MSMPPSSWKHPCAMTFSRRMFRGIDWSPICCQQKNLSSFPLIAMYYRRSRWSPDDVGPSVISILDAPIHCPLPRRSIAVYDCDKCTIVIFLFFVFDWLSSKNWKCSGPLGRNSADNGIGNLNGICPAPNWNYENTACKKTGAPRPEWLRPRNVP